MVIAIERRHVFSYEDYVEIAEKSPVRVEFWEGMILDMSGGSPRHSDKRCSTPSLFSKY